MSKNIQASLIRYNGDIGPTILDVEDKTDGPDGTTKPLTKEMLQQMIVANFPELQKVRDADVKTELELIKQQQSEILQRLNQPIDTQLSGSIEELHHSATENVTVTPGSSYKIVDDQNREDIKEIRGVIRWAFGSMRNWRFTINYVRNSGHLQINGTTHSIDFESQEALIKPMPLLTNKWNLEITNLSDNDEVYQRATIIGVK